MSDALPEGVRRLSAEPLGIRLWLAALDAMPIVDDACLGEAERQRAARFVFARDRRRYLASHIALHACLRASGVAAADLVFRLGPHGKPSLVSPANCSFNLSHSEGWALIGTSPAGEIGVDLEALRPVPERVAVAREHFSAAEASEVLAADTRGQLERFYTVWTRKEACLKAVGSGFSVRPDSFEAGCQHGLRRVRVLAAHGAPLVDVVSLPLDHGLAAAVARIAPGNA